ncbi:PH domain-containing protein [Bacillus sp. FJAT-22090]|uniref:PH domain-containing protein n=1 Tax=Bacillus sp. FJAT-22090 TaxID=1581038 RepID=UPI00119E2D86|nr:PH domain-containing protein [Bacillus sp. FJAT-22090]
MTFRSKRDNTFITFISVAIAIIGLATLLPAVFELFFTKSPDMTAVWITVGLFLLCAGFIVWISFDIEYTFTDEYLFVRGGPFRSKIPYEDITKVNPTTNIIAGYRILSSKDALEIHYKKALMGSVIISPKEQVTFLQVLTEKAPHIH